MLDLMDQEVEQAMKLTPSMKCKNRSTKKRLHPSITDQSYRYLEQQQLYPRPSINLLTKRRTV